MKFLLLMSLALSSVTALARPLYLSNGQYTGFHWCGTSDCIEWTLPQWGGFYYVGSIGNILSAGPCPATASINGYDCKLHELGPALGDYEQESVHQRYEPLKGELTVTGPSLRGGGQITLVCLEGLSSDLNNEVKKEFTGRQHLCRSHYDSAKNIEFISDGVQTIINRPRPISR